MDLCVYVFLPWKSFDYLFQEQCNYRIVKKSQITSGAHLQAVSDKAFFSTKKCLESGK